MLRIRIEPAIPEVRGAWSKQQFLKWYPDAANTCWTVIKDILIKRRVFFKRLKILRDKWTLTLFDWCLVQVEQNSIASLDCFIKLNEKMSAITVMKKHKPIMLGGENVETLSQFPPPPNHNCTSPTRKGGWVRKIWLNKVVFKKGL